MTKIVVKQLQWDEANVAHIKKHRVSVIEAELAMHNFIAHVRAKKGRYIAIGRSDKRLISLVIRRQATGVYYVVTARDASKLERSIVYEKEKSSNS